MAHLFVLSVFWLQILGKEIFMSDIQSAVNSFKLSFFKNNKTQNNNKVTEKLFAKYKLKSEDAQQKESQVDTSTIGLTLKDAVD